MAAERAPDIDELLEVEPDVVIVATTHDQLTPMAERALRAGAHVLVEKPAGLGTEQIDRLIEVAEDGDRVVKVGFNHRFHPAISELAAEVHSGRHGELMHLRARYGHGGRVGYDREWRAQPARSGGGELIDQGMHLLDLTHWIAGPLPLHSALLRTHFWDTEVEDNAALILGTADDRRAPWAMLHVDLDGVEEHLFPGGLLPDGEAPDRRTGALVRDAEASHLPHAARARPARSGGADLPRRGPVLDGGVGASGPGHRIEGTGTRKPQGRPLRLVSGAGCLRKLADLRGPGDRA